jgi:hypothetical protein
MSGRSRIKFLATEQDRLLLFSRERDFLIRFLSLSCCLFIGRKEEDEKFLSIPSRFTSSSLKGSEQELSFSMKKSKTFIGVSTGGITEERTSSSVHDRGVFSSFSL